MNRGSRAVAMPPMRIPSKLAFVAAVVIATVAGAFVGTALTPVAPSRLPNVRGAGPVITPPLQKLVVTSPYGPRVVRGKFGVHRRTTKGGLSVVVELDDGWRAG
jgi:hypothetical protein